MSFKITDSTKVYIAGCGGMLGDSVYHTFKKHCIVKATDINLTAPWVSYADVTDYNEISADIKKFNPDLIVNLAALTDLEYCEKNQEETWLANALGPENIGLVANELDVPLVYISTAGIVDGAQDVYNDFDQPNPLSIYAKAKYHGELFTQSHVRKFYVFRAGWMMGGGPEKDKKFINKIYKQLKNGQKELFVVDDKLGTPTYTKSFANGIFNVIQTGLYGVYNQVCNGDCSRYDVAKEFVNILGLEEEVKVTKVASDYFKAEYFAPRPFSEKLVNLKLNKRGINFMPDWKDALEDYAQVFKKDLV